MSSLTVEEFWSQLQQRQFAPVYLLYGAETYRRDQAVKTIADHVFGEADLRDFNDTSFSLDKPGNLMAALGAARQLPMMSERRIVRITDVRISATGIRDTIKEEDEPALSEFFGCPIQSSVVVFVADELNGNRKISKLLSGNAVSVEFGKLNEHQLMERARKELELLGVRADQLVLRQIVQRVGGDVRRLLIELDKLVTAALPEKEISPAMVDSLVPDSQEIDNWALGNSVVAGRSRMALELLRKMLGDGAEPLMILGMLGNYFHRLLLVKDLIGARVDRNEIVRRVRLYRNQDEFFGYVRRADADWLAQIVQRIAATDIAIKSSIAGSSPAGPRMLLEMLVCEISANPSRASV